jgi:hypothetical protein
MGPWHGPRRRADARFPPRDREPTCSRGHGAPPRVSLLPGSHRSHTEPSSAAVASWRLTAHQVRPAVVMVCIGDVPRALCTTEHDVEPLSATLDLSPPTQARGEGARERRVRPPERAGAAPGRSQRASRGSDGYLVSTDYLGSLQALRRCGVVCTPPERMGVKGPDYTLHAPQFTSGTAFFGAMSAHGHPWRPRSATTCGGTSQDRSGPTDSRFSRYGAQQDL